MEAALASRDVIEAMFSFLDNKTLLQVTSLVCRGWREVTDDGPVEDACRYAFWRHYRTQDETYPHDLTVISAPPWSWRAECKARHLVHLRQ